MASYRPFPPPQSSFPPPPPPPSGPAPPNQSSLPPPPPPPPPVNSQPYSQQPLNFPAAGGVAPSGYGRIPPNSAPHTGWSAGNQRQQPRPQQQYPYAPAPPLQQAPPPPPPQYYPSTQYPPQYIPPGQPQPPPPPPPPSSPPGNPSLPPQPPPPPPPVPPPSIPPPPPPPQAQSIPPHPSQHRGSREAGNHHQKPPQPTKQEKPSLMPPAPPRASAQGGRVETEEERRQRKKREYEKQKQEERRLHQLKQTQASILQKTQSHASGIGRPHGSVVGSRMGDRRTTPLLGAERMDNRLKKPTTFICKMKFRNELPDPTAQPKLMSILKDKDRANVNKLGRGHRDKVQQFMVITGANYTRYTITSLEKMHKAKLFVEQDLGIPLDLLDMSIYNRPADCPLLATEDGELLRDEEVTTPIKQEGIRRKDRPTDKGVSWLVKTQYISSLSLDAAKVSLTEKQAKEIRESKEGRNSVLENLNNREKQIQAIEESFRAAKLKPVHQTNPDLEPAEILPLLPDFDRLDDQLVMVNFDGDPTADSQMYDKLAKSDREELESQAVMKSYVVNSSDPSKPEKFLAYMVPTLDELSKDKESDDEDTSYSWVREYHWDVKGDDAEDPTTYLVTFGEKDARYLPLPTKLVLQKKKAKEGRTGEIEHFPAPAKVTVKRRRQPKEFGDASGKHVSHGTPNSKRGRLSMDNEERQHKLAHINQYSDEEDISD